MSRKVAFITGVTGQDGSYLSEFLIKKGYLVHGIKRRSSSLNTSRLSFYSPYLKALILGLRRGLPLGLPLSIRISFTPAPTKIFPPALKILGAMVLKISSLPPTG